MVLKYMNKIKNILLVLFSALLLWSCDYENSPSVNNNTKDSFTADTKLTLPAEFILQPYSKQSIPIYDEVLFFPEQPRQEYTSIVQVQDTGTNRFIQVSIDGGINIVYYTPVDVDLKNTKTKVNTTINPIYMAYLNTYINIYDMFFEFNYETDFGQRSGKVYDSQQSKEMFGLNDKASFILDFLVGYGGFDTEFSIQHFQLGEFEYYRKHKFVDGYDFKETFLFETKKRQLDVKYHTTYTDETIQSFNPEKDDNELFLGYRYVNYKSIKILYTLSKGYNLADLSDDDAGLAGESTPQLITINSNLVGIGISNLRTRKRDNFTFLYNLEMYTGYATTKMDGLDSNYDQLEFSENDYKKYEDMLISYVPLELGGAAGIRYNFDKTKNVWGFNLLYSANIYTIPFGLHTDVEDNEHTHTFGTPTEIFHSVKGDFFISF